MRVHVTEQIQVVADHDCIDVRLDDEVKLSIVEGEAHALGCALIAADAALAHDRLNPGRLGVEFEIARWADTG